MIRKHLVAAALLLAALLPAHALAQTCPALPFTFTPSTTIHASQVNSDFSSLLACANNSLAPLASPVFTGTVTIPTVSLTNPLAAAGGGAIIYVGGTSTGSANAQVVATLTPSGFALTAGNHIVWKAGFTNTAALTMNANSTGATNVFKMGTAGATALVGQEIQLNATYEALFDGTEFVLLTPTSDPTVAIPTGVCVDYVGTSAPAGWVFANSQVLSAGGANTNLISLMGTTFGSSGTTPDARGRATFGVDNMGGIGAASRLGSNSSTGGISGTASLGATGGAQTHVQTVAELAQHSHTIFPSGDTVTLFDASVNSGQGFGAANISDTFVNETSTGNTGSSTAFNVTPPAIVLNKICKL